MGAWLWAYQVNRHDRRKLEKVLKVRGKHNWVQTGEFMAQIWESPTGAS